MAGGYTFVDLFCGAGGLSAGFIQAGFTPLLAVDDSVAAVDTYSRNLGAHALCADLARNVSLPDASVVVGGPPCQGFSSAGLRVSGDERNTLVRRFAEIVVSLRPAAFVFENVEGFLTGDDGRRVLELLLPLIEAGYRVHLQKVNAANYGVPQHRKRVIAVGGLGWDPSLPPPTHSAHGAPGARLVSRTLPPAPNVADAFRGLPAPAGAEPGHPTDHYARLLDGVDLERARSLMQGQTMRDLPQELWHVSYRRRAFRRVMDGTPTERRGGAPAGVRRLRLDEPSKAITGGARSEFLHPVEDRYLTLRECARLQTFDDGFAFAGTTAERAQLIGNAVPPRLALAIARCLAADLAVARTATREGALLSFIPTLSAGMSPKLAQTAEAVGLLTSLSKSGARQLPLWA